MDRMARASLTEYASCGCARLCRFFFFCDGACIVVHSGCTFDDGNSLDAMRLLLNCKLVFRRKKEETNGEIASVVSPQVEIAFPCDAIFFVFFFASAAHAGRLHVSYGNNGSQ